MAVAECGPSRMKSLIVWHACGHNERHAVPCALHEDVRQRITTSLADERCWRCITGEAWEWLLSKPSEDL